MTLLLVSETYKTYNNQRKLGGGGAAAATEDIIVHRDPGNTGNNRPKKQFPK
jgi:hypothetical protein